MKNKEHKYLFWRPKKMQTSKKPLKEIVVKKTYFNGKRKKSRRKKKSKKVKKKMEVTWLDYSNGLELFFVLLNEIIRFIDLI